MRKGLTALGLVLMLALGYFVASPYLAVQNLKAAIKAGDQEQFEALIDLPVLRKNLKFQLNTRIAQPQDSEAPSNELTALVSVFASTLSNGLIDGLVTPAVILGWIQTQNLLMHSTPDSMGDAEPADTAPEPLQDAQLRFKSVNRFEIRLKNTQRPDFTLTLSRHGLTWKLSNITLPKGVGGISGG